MSDPSSHKVAQLRIPPEAKRRTQTTLWITLIGVAAIALAALMAWRPWVVETTRVVGGESRAPRSDEAAPSRSATAGAAATPAAGPADASGATGSAAGSRAKDDVVLTVSGYIINRERIELSPRFMGQVKWIGVKKGDVVTNGQVVCLLDDSEYRARRLELEGHLEAARVKIRRARIELGRIEQLARENIESQRVLDLARLDLEAALAEEKALEGQIALIDTYLEWTIIRSPINGVVLEKLVDPSELVTPQSFGGTRGPSTALISVGDPADLQVEIDLNEADLSRVFLGQKCRVSPEAYLDRTYEGVVAEVAPEASRQKGTLQIKVQILEPDSYLTPELSAKVDFLRAASSVSATSPSGG